MYKKIAPGVTYLFSSILATLANKHIVSTLGFKMQYFLVLLQSITIVTFLLLLKAFGIANFRFNKTQEWLFPSILLTIMIFSGFKALYYLPISIYTLFKNSSIIIVALLEKSLFNISITRISYISFVLMIFGSYLGNTSEIIMDKGYIWIFINISATTFYVLSLKIKIDKNNKTKSESVFYSNFISLPILAVLSYFFDEKNFDDIRTETILWILISSFFAFITCFSTAWTVNALSSTALNMLGGLNKSIGSFGGIIFLGESVNQRKYVSLLIGTISALLYSFGLIINKKRK